MYVIVTDSRKRNEVLFLVDRAKQQASFWSHNLDDVLMFQDRASAEKVLGNLRFNNPRIITLEEAVEISNLQDENHVQP